MRKIWFIAVREYNAAVRTKAFIVSVVLMPVFMVGGLVAQRLLKDQVDTTDKKLAVIDHTNRLFETIEAEAKKHNEGEIRDPKTGKKVKPVYIIERVEPNIEDPDAQRVELSDRIRSKDLYAFVEIGKDIIDPQSDSNSKLDILPLSERVIYHGESAAMDEMRRWLHNPLNNEIRVYRLAGVDIDADVVDRLTRYVQVEPHGLVSLEAGKVKSEGRRSEGQLIATPIIMMFLMFMMIMIGAPPLINSVLEEKMQRIAEVLLGSVTPFQVMFGKLLGTVGVSLTMVILYVGGGILLAERTNASEYIPYHLLPWFIVFQIMAIFMFGAMFIAVGAACSDLKEAQSMTMPVMVMVMVPLFVWVNVVKEPLSSFATWMSLVPTCTPLLMLLRQATPASIPAWQPWAGLGGVILFTVFCVWAAGRIFRVGLLLQGKPPKITDLMRWAIRG
jgi:ABC-2 type transport system permease protein